MDSLTGGDLTVSLLKTILLGTVFWSLSDHSEGQKDSNKSLEFKGIC